MKRKEITKTEVKIWTLSTLLVCAVIVALRLFLFDIDSVQGMSMDPNLKSGDVLIGYRADIAQIERDDIVVAKVEGVDGSVIKRVVGLPGDHITIDLDGHVYINGELFTDYDITSFIDPLKHTFLDVTLSDGEYFLLGDNRSVSYDSRQFGPIHISRIKSKILVRMLPFTVF